LHDIFIDNNKVGTGIKIGDGIKTYPANPGSHKVSVNGYYPAGTLFSYGEKTVTVIKGQKAKCDITMKAPTATVTDITYTASPNVVKNTTAINFTFSAAVTGLTAGEITVANGTGAATKGALTENSGTSWSLAVTVTTAGNVSVSIAKSGIESGAKTVTVAVQGDGSSTKPFLVFDVDDLSHVGKPEADGLYDNWGLDKHYKQMDNIDLSSVPNWTPIGNTTTRFTGSYDGGGHTISNLKITSTAANGVGLFGGIGSGAVVEKVGVNCNITSSNNMVGGVVASNSGGKVQNCYATGSVSGPTMVGGVVGGNATGGTVHNCYSTCSVTGTGDTVGGVVGNNGSNSTVQNCYATGNVSGTGSAVGGVVGSNGDTTSTVKNCYATGNVSGDNSVGGVQGSGQGDAANVQNCVALCPNIAGSGTYVNRVAGITESTGTSQVTNCYGRSNMKKNNADESWYSDAGYGWGADITVADWGSASWWQAQGFTTANWDFSGIGATQLPKLNGMPGGTAAQNPVIQ
jgi:hypothetical protein